MLRKGFVAWLTLMLLGAAAIVYAQAPSTTAKAGTATIAGQVKISGAAAPGVSVSLISAEQPLAAPGGVQGSLAGRDASVRAVTDAEGRFFLSNLAAGRFRVSVLAPGYVIPNNNLVVQVNDGQALTGVDFTLTRGAVVTGRVTTSGDRPVIGEPVMLLAVNDTNQNASQTSLQLSPLQLPNANSFRTDDRGVYRIYGVPAGKYVVSAGRGDGGRGDAGRGDGGRGLAARGPNAAGGNTVRTWVRTYHPDVTDSAQATVIEVEAGKEIEGVNIHLTPPETFVVSGRVVDAETGQPVPGVLIGHGRTSNPQNRGNGGARNNGGNAANRRVLLSNNTDGTTNKDGEFRVEGVTAGDYAVYVAQDQAAGQSDYYSEPVAFTVSSSDVGDLEIKLLRGASIVGQVVFEGASDPQVLAKLVTLTVNASSRGGRGGGGASGVNMPTNLSSPVAANGSFRIAGLAPGQVNLNVTEQGGRGPFSGLTILRIERGGANVQSGLRVEAGEQVAGVRIVAAYGTGVIRGLIRVEGGALTPGMRLTVFARRTDASRGVGGGMPAQVINGRFQIERLVAGTYEVSVQLPGAGRAGGGQGGRAGTASQTVTLGNGGVQDVVIPLNLAELQLPPNGQNGQPRQPNRPRGGRP